MKLCIVPAAITWMCFFASFAPNAFAAVRCVYMYSATPAPPYATWDTAAATIQDAINAARPGDVILVTNGIYQTGGRAVCGKALNRVAITVPVTVQSVNGPGATIIKGYCVPGITNADRAVRCAYLTNGAALIGFTLADGATRAVGDPTVDQAGAGVWCESVSAVVSNCIISGNRSHGLAGGAFRGTLDHCIVTDNSALDQGGGAYECVLKNCLVYSNSAGNSCGAAYLSRLTNCTVVANSARNSVGGTDSCKMNGCIVYNNRAPIQANWALGIMSYSCTVPLPKGSGNITNDPLFVDPKAGDFHLQPKSPCINSGCITIKFSGVDLDGAPRTAGAIVDIGAYEFQKPGSVLPYAWLQQYRLPTDGSADFGDPDRDGANTWLEWRSGTNPTNSLSTPPPTNAEPATVRSGE
jgi:hypothetical protein